MENNNRELGKAGQKNEKKQNRASVQPSDKRNFAFGKTNFILLAVGLVVVIIGFVMMSGSGSTEKVFDPDIFSTMRIKVAPVVTFIGFISIIGAVLYKPKDNNDKTVEA